MFSVQRTFVIGAFPMQDVRRQVASLWNIKAIGVKLPTSLTVFVFVAPYQY